MTKALHQIGIVVGGLAAILPQAGALPAGTPKPVMIGVSVVGFAAALLSSIEKARGK